MKKKRILSTLLVMVMLITVLPLQAFAAYDDDAETATPDVVITAEPAQQQPQQCRRHL